MVPAILTRPTGMYRLRVFRRSRRNCAAPSWKQQPQSPSGAGWLVSRSSPSTRPQDARERDLAEVWCKRRHICIGIVGHAEPQTFFGTGSGSDYLSDINMTTRKATHESVHRARDQQQLAVARERGPQVGLRAERQGSVNTVAIRFNPPVSHPLSDRAASGFRRSNIVAAALCDNRRTQNEEQRRGQGDDCARSFHSTHPLPGNAPGARFRG